MTGPCGFPKAPPGADLPVPQGGRLRLVRAGNPSPMTGSGTNTWIVGEGAVAVIDPGPALPGREDAILGALGPGERISHILVTHAHLDHSAAARPLARRSGAEVLAFGLAVSGRTARMAALAAQGLEGGEGLDTTFRPDRRLSDGGVVTGEGWRITALHTPGHLGGHLSFLWGGGAFSGDHVMGWSTSVVAPPDGDMGAYMESLSRLAAAAPAVLWPGHGPVVADPAARIGDLAAHRRAREAQILSALGGREDTAAGIAARVYAETPAALMPAAARNVLAHLIDLLDRGLVHTGEVPTPSARFRRT